MTEHPSDPFPSYSVSDSSSPNESAIKQAVANSPVPSAEQNRTQRQRLESAGLIGPGLLESCGWFLGAWGCHLIGMLLTVGLLVAILMQAGMTLGSLEMLEFLEAHQLTLLAGEQFLFVLVMLLAAWWRLGGRLGQRLGSRPLPGSHLFLLTCLIIPVSAVSSLIHLWGMTGWEMLLDHWPALQRIDTQQSMHLLQELRSQTPVWALLLVFAVAPALGEELVFRGVIGRGLVARWGMLPGILLTSALFALAHIHPVHALAVFPVGLVLHYVYYTTRSFWAPLYVHFGNNALAVLITSAPGSVPVEEGLTLSAIVTVSLSLVVFLAFLWSTRVHFVKDDGTAWQAPWCQLELPVELPLRRSYAGLSWPVSLGGLVPLIGFLIAYTVQI